MDQLILHFFGPFTARKENAIITGFESNKVRGLLVFLAMETGRPHARDSLATMFWPDWTDRAARNNLRYALANLRKVTGDQQASPPHFNISRDMIAFNVHSRCFLDVVEFTRLASAADPTTPTENKIAQLEQALLLYKGELLEGFAVRDAEPFEEWLRIHRERYHHHRLQVMARLTALYEAGGNLEDALSMARQMVEIETWNEDSQRQLIRLLARNGQRGAALAQYETFIHILTSELQLEPSKETRSLVESIREGDIAICSGVTKHSTNNPPALPSSAAEAHNLPNMITNFIGREKEIGDILQLLKSHRLVTLHGSGGTGKTRLAIEVARTARENFQDGAWMVEFGSLNDPDLIFHAIIDVFPIRPEGGQPLAELLVNYLLTRDVLLVFDNCEHLIQACANTVEWILKKTSHVHILCTSRETLGIIGEAPYRVPSLTLPNDEAMESMLRSEAVTMFRDRAAVIMPRFELHEDNASAILQICRRLDGIPLALELAAVRLRTLGIRQIAARLDDCFRLLSVGNRTALPRQQTLRATIDWSYHLLDAGDQLLFQRLSVFSGGWTLEAAEEICADSGNDGLPGDEVLDRLDSLVNKSLVVMEGESDLDTRYRMLETVRQYAWEKLEESNQQDRLRSRHLHYLVGWGAQAQIGLHGRDMKRWIKRFHQEIDNARAALEWSLRHDQVAGLRLAQAINWYYESIGWVKEGQDCLLLFLADPAPSAYPEKLFAETLAQLAYTYKFSDYDLATKYADQSIAAIEGKEPPLAMAMIVKALVALQQGETDDMHAYLTMAESLSQKEGNYFTLHLAKNVLGRDAMNRDDVGAAWQHWSEMRNVAIESGNPRLLAWADLHICIVMLDRGEVKEARRLLEAAKQTLFELGEYSIGVPALGLARLMQGDYLEAHSAYKELYDTGKIENYSEVVIAALLGWAYLALFQNEDDRKNAYMEELKQLLVIEEVQRQLSDETRFIIHYSFAEYLVWEGRFQEAEEYLERNRRCAFRPSHYYEARDWGVWGELAFQRGELQKARHFYGKSLLSFTRAHNVLNRILCLERCIDLLHQSEPVLAAQVVGFVDAFRKRNEMPRHPRFASHYDELSQTLRHHLGTTRWDQAIQNAREQSHEEMILAVLDVFDI